MRTCPGKANFTSAATTEPTTKSAGTRDNKDPETIAQLRKDLDKAKQDVAARDATAYEQAAGYAN